jgi:hypothetical protein
MAQSNESTTVSNLAKGYGKSHTKLYTAFKSRVEEFSWMDDIDDEEIEVSGRENLIPLDIKRGYGTAMITDGGYEARTVTPAMNEGSFSFVQANGRFFISRFAQALDQRARKKQIVRQIKYQSKKTLEGMARRCGLQFYGFTTGVVALTSTNATATSGQAYTLIDAFGQAGIDNAAYLASLFEVGDGVAIVTGGSLETNAIGLITAKSASTPSITVTWAGSVDADANDEIYFANAVTDTTITATDRDRWPTGLLDIITSSSVMGLATSSEANWAAALNNADGGRFSAVKLKKMKQAIMNASDGTLTDIIWAQGVENDVEAGERAARIYNSSSMDLDMSIKAKGIKFRSSPLTPPGYVFGYDNSGWGKKLLTDKPNEDGSPDFGDLYKAEDRSGFKGGFDFIWATPVRCRGKFAMYSGITEQ